MFSVRYLALPPMLHQTNYISRPLELLRLFLLTKHSDPNNFYLVWDVAFSVNINYPGIHCRRWNYLGDNPGALSSPIFSHELLIYRM